MRMTLRVLTLAASLAAAAPAVAQVTPPDPAAPNYSNTDHSNMDHMQMDHMQMDHAGMNHAGMEMPMGSAYGGYPMTRDASGTAWQPDAGAHGGVHAMHGNWSLMGHALFNGVYASQDGPRGDDKTFLAGMVMGAARYDTAAGDTINLRAMLSPDPFMGKRGYPLLLAAGETADGVSTLTDRQHPHDLFMELSASVTHRLSDQDSIYVYAGLPGEPAFGPPAFMHRQSAMDDPEAPISHHWLDSTHITYGVATAGFVHDNWKLEASRFRGREPDEHRFDIETGALDSTAARVSFNPGERWALQASWADVKSPEALHPDEDETRYSASAIYTAPIAGDRWWSTTLAFGRKDRSDGVALDAWLFESALKLTQPVTLFTRAERVETDELTATHGDVHTVSRLSLGGVYDFRLNDAAVIGLGATVTKSFVPGPLEAAYDGDPEGGSVFVRLKIG